MEKGWAPIFNTLNRNKKFFVISGILPADEVDSGDIVCQAKFEIKDNHTAESIREFDHEISIMMIKLICEKFEKNTLTGKKQNGIESFFPRRKPDDNEIDSKLSISENFNFLRACEKQHPAFFFFNKTKYFRINNTCKQTQIPIRFRNNLFLMKHNMIPHNLPTIGIEEEIAALRVLRSKTIITRSRS